MSVNRRIATLATLGLATAGLTGLTPQPATAVEGGAVLRWGVSSYLDEHLGTQAFTDGATESVDGIVSFAHGIANGNSVRYDGAARYAFANPVTGAELYSLTFADPIVTLGDAGTGTLAADVSWTIPGGSGSVEDTVVATFATDDDWADGVLTATPDWLGVAVENAYGDGKPVGGASWAPGFVAAVPTSLRPFFYASGSTSDAKKAPAAFSAEEGAGPTVTQATSYDAGAVLIEASGTGFTAVTQAGDMGVYVGLAPSGGMPDTSSQEDMDSFADAEWVTPTQMPDGSWQVTLDPDNAALDPSQTYSIYTWQAHTHSNTSQDTETPVAIDWSQVGAASKLTITRKARKLVVANADAAGTVAVKLTKGSARRNLSAAMENGKASVALPRLAAGRWTAVVTYRPSTAEYRTAKRTVTIRVS